MDRRDPYRDASPAGTAEELLLQGDRYRDATFGRDDDDILPFLSPEDDDDGTSLVSDAETDVEVGDHADDTRKHSDTIATAAWYQAKRPANVIFLVALILFFLVFAATLALVPMMRLVEDAICRRHYGVAYGPENTAFNSTRFATQSQFLDDDRAVTNPDTDERLCKVDAVQAELAWLGGVVSVTEALLGLLASFPWALLSDRIGRKPVFRVAFVGAALSFGWTSVVLLHRDVLSVWWVLTSQVLLLVGGGAGVAGTILHAVVVDVLVADRASGFIALSLGAVVGSIVGPACAALLMANGGSAWPPICVTLFVLAPAVLLLTVFLPETLPRAASASPSSSPKGTPFWSTIPAHVRETRQHLLKTLAVLRRSRAALLLLPSFLFSSAMQAVQGGILAQSVSKRFGWSLAQTGYLFSFRGVVTIVVLALLPVLSTHVLMRGAKRPGQKTRRGLGLTEHAKDLLLARASLVCLVAGNVLMAAGTSLATLVVGLVLSTLAVGFGSMTRSLVTHYFLKEANAVASSDRDSSDHTSRLYSLTGMVETLGSVLAGPLLAWTFSSGLALGGRWIGLPFYYVATLCAIALVCLLLVRDSEDEADADQDVGLGQIALS